MQAIQDRPDHEFAARARPRRERRARHRGRLLGRHLRLAEPPGFGCLLLQALVGSRLVEIPRVFFQHAHELTVTQDQHVIQALAP